MTSNWLLFTKELEEEIKRLKALPKPKQEVKQEIKQTTKPVETKEILGLGIIVFHSFKFRLKSTFCFFLTFLLFLYFFTFLFPSQVLIQQWGHIFSGRRFFGCLDLGNSGRKRRRNSNRIQRPFPRRPRNKWHQPLRRRMYHLQWWKRTGNRVIKTICCYSVDWRGELPELPRLMYGF